MTDFKYILETMLLLGLPLAPVAAGYILRKKFAAPKETGAAIPPGRKAGRFAGNILFWGGILGVLFMIAVLLNFNGKI